MLDYILVAGGLVALLAGGEALVRGAVAVAQRAGLSPLVIGATLVGFGTSAPELFTSLDAGLRGADGIAVGNVVGSNIANILLILGLAALIRPVVIPGPARIREMPMLAIATGAAGVLMMDGALGRWDGALLFAGLLTYLTLALVTGRAQPADVEVGAVPQSLAVALGSALIGLVLIILGANWLVDGASGIALALGVPETVIGLTLVAVGTSLPELVTSVVAARRGHGEVALGNVLGSNIFNLLGILGLTALITPLEVPARIISGDNWAMAAVTAALCALCLWGRPMGRLPGAVLLLAYLAYVVWTAV